MNFKAAKAFIVTAIKKMSSLGSKSELLAAQGN
jgi:hypothetical protein